MEWEGLFLLLKALVEFGSGGERVQFTPNFDSREGTASIRYRPGAGVVVDGALRRFSLDTHKRFGRRDP